jgi:hypothetical protein
LALYNDKEELEKAKNSTIRHQDMSNILRAKYSERLVNDEPFFVRIQHLLTNSTN